MKPTAAKTVNEYIIALPPKPRKTLEKMRKMIKSALPAAEEVISYQIPIFKFNGPVAALAAFDNHCSYYTMSHGVMKTMKEELKNYDSSGVTVRFPIDKPLPASLVKKLLLAKLEENEMRIQAKKNKTLRPNKKSSSNPTDSEVVDAYLQKLKHPLKAEILEVRENIRKASKKISERIKWNAPSYYYLEDMVTFNHRNEQQVHLVFHHPYIVRIKSPLLEGDYKDRRMMYFKNMSEVRKGKPALQKIIKELVALMDR